VFVTEEKLSVKVAEINGVKVYDVNFAIAGEEQVLEKLAANATRSYHQYPGL
jgi:hypothetical protein